MRRTVLLFLVFWSAAGLLVVRAAIPSPSPYGILSADEKRLLVMRTGKQVTVNGSSDLFLLPDGRELILQDAFPKSGVYDLTTLSPVWQVDWFAYKGSLLTSQDLETQAVIIDHAMENGDGRGLLFYSGGQIIRQYRCDELLKSLRSPLFFQLTSWNWHLDWYSNFEAKGDTLILKTSPRLLGAADYRLNLGMQDSWVFDLRTGEVLESKTLGKERFVGFLLAAGALLLMPWLIWLLRGKRHGKNPGSAGTA